MRSQIIIAAVLSLLAQSPIASYAQIAASDQTNQVDQMPIADEGAATASEIPAPPVAPSALQPNRPANQSQQTQATGLAPTQAQPNSNPQTQTVYGPQWPSNVPYPQDAQPNQPGAPLNIVPPPPTPRDLAYMQAQANWRNWVAAQPAACGAGLDSYADFNPKSNKVAIIIHGLGGSPQSMAALIKLFKAQGFTVLAPRLSGHFEKNLKALDKLSYSKWVVESEQVFELAKGFGDRITVVGHSLGGLLASRLAIKYPDQIERAVLFAPAWRVRPLVTVATHFGSLFDISLNDQYDIEVACKVDHGYVPASAGKQIQSLINRTEKEFGGNPDADADSARASIFARIRVPRIVITSPEDDAVDSEMIAAACPALKTGCLDISIPTAKHEGITKNLNAVSTGKWAHSSIKSILTKFLSMDGRARQAKLATK